MINDSKTVRIPDDLLARMIALESMVSPFTKPTLAHLARAILTQGIETLERRRPTDHPNAPLAQDVGSPTGPVAIDTQQLAHNLGVHYATQEHNANARREGNGATEWFHKHDSQLEEDLLVKGAPVTEALRKVARIAFRATLDGLPKNKKRSPKRTGKVVK